MGTTVYTVTSESALDAAIAAINSASTTDPAGTNYMILLEADLTLTANIQAINLAAGHVLTVEGLNTANDLNTALIDGDGAHRGFVVNSGSVAFTNLNLQAMNAPGGSGGVPGGGGALYVGAGASVSTNGVAFSGDTASGGTPAGGAVFLAAGGSLALTGGSIAGSGHNGLFIQGNNSVALNGLTVSGVIADQTGSHLGTGAGTVVAQGAVTLGATSSYTGGTQIEGTLTLLAPAAAGTGAITFTSPSGETLIAGAGDAPANQIAGFAVNPAGWTTGDAIDLQGIGAPVSDKLAAGNHLTVVGSTGTVTLNLDPAQNYTNDAFVLSPDAGTAAAAGTLVQVTQNGFQVASEADLNAALAAIDLGGRFSAPHTAYTITLTPGFTLTGDIDAVNLNSTDSLVINGGGATIDGAGTYRGFFAYAGSLTLNNLTVRNTVARGGAGGAGATPGGGGAGLGGGLFVNTGAAVTLANVNFINDQAIGGAAGAAGTIGIGGGGGLGGAGGNAGAWSALPRNGGGGGIGVAATGGSSGSGGPGIVIGGAAANPGTGNRIAGGTAGAYGGGGGAAGIITTGGGRGGSRTYSGQSGSGGLGGSFGGGAGSAEGAGFGGGGANSAGGWGGGGSGANGGGFGGGAGVAGGAGGGLGAGGAVFVAQGGVLLVGPGSLSGGSVAPGAGGTSTGGSGGSGTAGSAFGSGIFVQGSNTVTLDPAPGQTLTIGDVIADQSGSDPGNVFGQPGAGALLVTGGGTVTLSQSNSFTGGVTIADGSTLLFNASGAAGSGTIDFAASSGTLAVSSVVPSVGFVANFGSGDVVDALGLAGDAPTYDPIGNILTLGGAAGIFSVTFAPGHNYQAAAFQVMNSGTDALLTYTACYLAGTRIATPSGEVAIENLRVGEHVQLAAGGTAPVLWLGHRELDCTPHPCPCEVWPVRIAANAFGPGRPARPLWLSPDHAVSTDGVLIPVRYLVNGATIVQVPMGTVEYWHLELSAHDVVLAEGLTCESYLDTGNRAAFESGSSSAETSLASAGAR